MDHIWHYTSPLGGITLASDGESLIGLWFDGQRYFGAGLSEEAAERQLPVFEKTARWLDIYFSGTAPDFTPKIAPRGTEFRMRVWRILMEIPWGQTITYGEIASRIERERGGVRMSARAVGSAVGHNPISLIIPCHRVTGSRGSLTGYAAGIDKKFRLLEMEKANQSGSFIPQR